MNENNYFIKTGYISNSSPINYLATLEEDLVYQLPVYKFAADITTRFHCNSAIDFGCGLEIVSHEIVELREGMNTCQLAHGKCSNLA